MTTRNFAGITFDGIGAIQPDRDPQGTPFEFMPQSRYRDVVTAKVHAYGSGPFCRFRVARGRREAGLYVLTLDDAPVYAGECNDLGRRFGSNGYGGISPRNCFDGGQPTNCRINASILAAAKAGQTVELWFVSVSCAREERLLAETQLIRMLAPPWNKSKRFGGA